MLVQNPIQHPKPTPRRPVAPVCDADIHLADARFFNKIILRKELGPPLCLRGLCVSDMRAESAQDPANAPLMQMYRQGGARRSHEAFHLKEAAEGGYSNGAGNGSERGSCAQFA